MRWNPEHHTLEVLRAVSRQARPVGAGEWAGEVAAAAGALRIDRAYHYRRLAAALLRHPRRHAAAGITTVAPTSAWLVESTGLSARTVRRWWRWMESERLVVVVEHGTTARTHRRPHTILGTSPNGFPPSGNRAAVYALTSPNPNPEPEPRPEPPVACAPCGTPWAADTADKLAAEPCWGRRLHAAEVAAIRRIIDRYAPGATLYEVRQRIEWAGHTIGPAKSPAGLIAYRLSRTQAEHEALRNPPTTPPPPQPARPTPPPPPAAVVAHTECRPKFWGTECQTCHRPLPIDPPPDGAEWPMIRRLRWWAAHRGRLWFDATNGNPPRPALA